MPRKVESPTLEQEDPQAVSQPMPEVEEDLDAPPGAPEVNPARFTGVARTPRRTPEPTNTSIEAMVVYLGSNPKKSVYLPGSVSLEADMSGHPVWVPTSEGASTYDFSRIDNRGRIIKTRLTKDNHVFSICRHMGHLVKFMNQVSEDGSVQFEVRTENPNDLARIERYARLLLEAEIRNKNQGRPVLEAMGLE